MIDPGDLKIYGCCEPRNDHEVLPFRQQSAVSCLDLANLHVEKGIESSMRKIKNNKAFTLAELLIVVAIIAVLVAIAIPVFTNQLERSKESTDLANIRSAYATAVTKVLETNSAASATAPAAGQRNTTWDYESGQLTVMNDAGTSIYSGFAAKTAGDYTVTVQAGGSVSIS